MAPRACIMSRVRIYLLRVTRWVIEAPTKESHMSQSTPETELRVAAHYTHGSLEVTILEALRSAGKDTERLRPADLSEVDEFHLGWRDQTVALAKELDLASGMTLLDVGSGIGGPARYFAAAHGCRVTGIDLTAEFVAVATSLTRRCGLADQVDFRQASALALPFAAASFERATQIHVGMNIADKARVFAEVRRVLKPGGLYAVYDVMRMTEGDLPYPMPWAETAATSFVETPEAYRRLLAGAGFALEKERNRREFCLDLAARKRADAAAHGAPALSLQLIMGPTARDRLAHSMATLERGLIAPVEMLARAV
jgi:SAM-dependent methyltransferase